MPLQAGVGMILPDSHGEKPPYWVLGITRDYRTVFLPEHGFTVYTRPGSAP
ncbi:hypothetical protein [Micromonospora sp. NBC_01796]|uniref:hypothetical protein n=1 Tax=Micromonospora sp. NBC_01796 TaxID=2975987 RepID=UPI002DD83031|nr:hypothetical protein [Micromonospora sp. NBC_01796]WSA87076.1 hypothetical protein OIE47_05495 [Micromonospora sp. NBC_01796]